MWKVISHLECSKDYDTFETREDASIEMHRLAEDLADLQGAHVFHNNEIGLSTVWDNDGEYVCFWIREEN